MDVSRMPKEGDRFGNWIIERTLDKGGMGMVYLAYNPDLGKGEKVALKVLDPAVAERNADFVRRFYQEASIVFNTHCPHLVSVHDAGREPTSGFYYIVMEYLGGGTLRDRMRRQGRLPWREALAVVRPVAQALTAIAGRNSVHRDIKPENIMFTADGEVKLADFGIAKATQDDSENMLETRPAQVFGTPAYMSPEQIQDASTVDARADIWSLGIVLFEMLAGVRPYPGKSFVEIASTLLSEKPIPDVRTFQNPSARAEATCATAVTEMKTEATLVVEETCANVVPTIPPGVADLLARMCAKNLKRRMATGEEVVAAIDGLLNREEDVGGPDSGTAVGAASRKRPKIVCAVVVIVLAAASAVLLLDRERGREPTAPVAKDPPPSAAPVAKDPPPSAAPAAKDPPPSAAPAAVEQPPTAARVVPSEVVTNALSKPPKPCGAYTFQPKRGTVGDVLTQLDAAIARKPEHLRVSLTYFAQRKDLSIERYEQQLLVPAVERLRTSGVSFSFVVGAGRYGLSEQNVAKRFGCDME